MKRNFSTGVRVPVSKKLVESLKHSDKKNRHNLKDKYGIYY